MKEETEIHPIKKWEQIEVLGLLDTRKDIEEFEPTKLTNGNTKPNRYVQGLAKTPKSSSSIERTLQSEISVKTLRPEKRP